MKTHAHKAAKFLRDARRAAWHDETLWMVRRKRDAAAASTPNWEELREQASLIKEETIAQLPAYIRQFAEAAKQNGAIVMEAANDVLMCGYIATLLRVNGVKRVVKSKSMLTEECGLNQYLAIQGLEVTDTDLGECIMQLRKEPPSHIVLPAIHLRKEEIGKTFHRNLGSQKGASDPDYLTEVARKYLRQKFLTADAAITGVNFAVAETGTVVVCTNEGNADMGIHAAPLQIHCVGIDKVIPRMTDLGVFTRLLARSATGQAITSYTSHYNKPKPGGKMYVIIVDNGRNKLSHNHAYRNALKCIRCGACINTCPVYRRSGGHSYGSLIPGPIGSVLAPLRNPAASADLPFACSLCGSCANVCPVKVSLHENLYNLRQELNSQGSTPLIRRAALKVAAWGLSNNALYRTGGAIGRLVLRYFPAILYIPLRSWTKGRKLPVPPRQTFQQWYSKHESRKKI